MIHQKKFYPIVLILLLMSCSALAGSISGTVTSSETGRPLNGAHVILEGNHQTTITDVNGQFDFTNLLSEESFIISASYVGYHVEKLNVLTGKSEVEIKLNPMILNNSEVVFSASRAISGITPSAFTNVDGAKLREGYWAQDIPPLLENIPGVYAYSETGTGIGYTHLKVRGFDQKRVGVTINNIPHNDPEDGTVYWVDIPDLAANVQDVQLQRGVGFSNYGTGGFGGTLNLMTATPGLDEASVELSTGGGSFNTRKWSAKLNSGVVDNTYGIYARFSQIQSDGYRHNSSGILWGYFLGGVYYGTNSILKFNVYGGVEETHAAWNASPILEIEKDRRHNPDTYENTIDHFTQPHYEIHHDWFLSDNITMNNSLFYIRGEGYYEQFKEGKDLVDFGYQPIINTPGVDTTFSTDFINQKWVKKDHVGWLPKLKMKHYSGELTIGADLQWYQAEHYGFVIWGKELPTNAVPHHKYYGYNTNILQGGMFFHERFDLNEKVSLVGDIELRAKEFSFEQETVANYSGDEVNYYDDNNLFLNPKFGINYKFSQDITLYSNVAISHRAPVNDEYWDQWAGPDDLGQDPLFLKSDTILTNGTIDHIEWSDASIDPERVIDFELGASYTKNNLAFKGNVYWMDFTNEIIPSGGIRDGSPVVDNAEKSIHRGIELEVAYRQSQGLNLWANASFSDNRLRDYVINEWGGATTDLSDNIIALFPSTIISSGIGYRIKGVYFAFNLRSIGKQYLDNTENEDRVIEAHIICGLTLAYQLPKVVSMADFELSLKVNNLFDAEYEAAGYYDAWGGGNSYFVGAERNIFLNLTARL
jgi:iron complex outermembrane recepter protein